MDDQKNVLAEFVTFDDVTYSVVARQSATNNPPHDKTKAVTISTIDELLCTDPAGDVQTFYECVHPDRGDCSVVFTSVRSALAHQRKHSSKIALARKEREDAAERERRSAGQRTANDAKQKRYKRDVTSTNPKVQKLQRRLSDLAFGVAKLTEELLDVAENLTTVCHDLGEVESARPDEAVLAKAKKWDDLQKLMR